MKRVMGVPESMQAAELYVQVWSNATMHARAKEQGLCLVNERFFQVRECVGVGWRMCGWGGDVLHARRVIHRFVDAMQGINSYNLYGSVNFDEYEYERWVQSRDKVNLKHSKPPPPSR